MKWDAVEYGQYQAIVNIGISGRKLDLKIPMLMEALQAWYDNRFQNYAEGVSELVKVRLNDKLVDLYFIGLSEKTEFLPTARKLGDYFNQRKTEFVYLSGLDKLGKAQQNVFLTELLLTEYSFFKYFSKPKKIPERVYFSKEIEDKDAHEIVTLAESVKLARDLVNEPSEVMNPERLAQTIKEIADNEKLECEILDKADCEKLGMGLFMAVSSGGKYQPKFMILRYRASEEKPICIIGKGITYDSGGLNLKSVAIENMRFDMNGAATALGVILAASRMQLKRSITVLIAACENLISSEAYRPGEILHALNGKTIYVGNTDCEGRLTMADAIAYAVKYENPQTILDVAGLTGSVYSFLGPVCGAILTNNEEIERDFLKAGKETEEPYLSLPHLEAYRESIRSPYADLTNVPSFAPGIGAGFFLEEFSGEIPFIHIDLGAMPFRLSVGPGQAIGATGAGIRSIYHWIKSDD